MSINHASAHFLRLFWANPDESGYPEPMRGRFHPGLCQAARDGKRQHLPQTAPGPRGRQTRLKCSMEINQPCYIPPPEANYER